MPMSLKILVLGATGMLGSQLFIDLNHQKNFPTYGSVRHPAAKSLFPAELSEMIITGVDAQNFESVRAVITVIQPTIVINCIGLVKQTAAAKDPVQTILINALFPQQLAVYCKDKGCRLIQISTDCVFDGSKGNYRETDSPNPPDLYGRTKLLGEIVDNHCLTIRTSIIGHELQSAHGLIQWFLSQTHPIKGFTQAIFSGIPTVELSRIIADYIIPRPELTGLYHVAADPISKYQLLNLVKTSYQKSLPIQADDTLKLDRSLNASRFQQATGYTPPPWPQLIRQMHNDYCASPLQQSYPKGGTSLEGN